MNSIRLKLNSAFSKQDILLISYLVSTNLWKVLEGIWALNQKPVPPSSSLYRRYRDLNFIPCPDWFDRLLMGDIESKGRMMMYSIDWILNEMNK